MGFKAIAHTTRVPRRVHIVGGPNRGKTQSLTTWPRHTTHPVEGDMHVISMPGEKGWETLPTGLSDFHGYMWEANAAEKSSSKAVLDELERLTFDTLSGKNGKVASFAVDGFHKFYDHVLNYVTNGDFFAGLEFEPRLYGRAHEHAKYYMDRVLSTPCPNVVFTTWDGTEPDRDKLAGEKASDVPRHILPELPGKMAKKVMGEFPITVYADLKYVTSMVNGKQVNAVQTWWQLRPHGMVWAAAIKAPKEIVERLPLQVEQSYNALAKALETAWTATLKGAQA